MRMLDASAANNAQMGWSVGSLCGLDVPMGPERPPALLLNLLLQFHIELGQVDVQLQDEQRQIVSVVLEQQLKNENVVYTNCIYIQYI